MTPQLNRTVGTALPREQQRRLIRYLGQLACRRLSAVHAWEGLAHDGDERRAALRERVAVEHGLAHLSQRQGNRARYNGTRKNPCHM